jgi:hypothetical protein
LGSSVDQDNPPNLEIIAEGAELEVPRRRSATLPANVTLEYSVFEDKPVGFSIGEEEEEIVKPQEEAGAEAGKAEPGEKLYDQQPFGEHKFYSFTR